MQECLLMVWMKKIIAVFFILGLAGPAQADHITGGEMFYTTNGLSNGLYQYSVTLKLYMRCNSGRQFNNPTIVSIFDRVSGQRISDQTVSLSSQENISLPSNSNPCISNPPNVCYDVGYYRFNISLPASANGYVLASQVNYRIAGINNLAPGYGLIGATYTTEIPGTSPVASGPQNNSAHFTGSDLVMVCADNPFTYSFAASDADNDQLRYSFCGAYVSGSSGTVAATPPPPFQFVPYGPFYSPSTPLGNNVHINQATGLITGIAPVAGVYVVTVCVEEIRNGTVIATQRKDLQLFIAPCTIAAATLQPEYMLCRDTKNLTVSNGSSSPLIHSYNWLIFTRTGALLYITTTATINYNFADTGIYRLKLYINKGDQCSDSAESIIRVYPGFVPAFTATGFCFNKPTSFEDATSSVYGIVNSWNWDFGETPVTNDVSILAHPVYTYPTQGAKTIRLIVTDTKGCRDTLNKNISIVEKPPVSLAFRDTLICVTDSVQLTAFGVGDFSWTPAIHMINANTPYPKVAPVATTVYSVQLNDNGCINKDSVSVRVVDHVSLQVMNDTVICQGDTIRLRHVSDGLRYSWSPASFFVDPSLAMPLCITNSNTVYQVRASIGSCSALAAISINTVPYPFASAGNDTVICYGTAAQLHGETNGTSFSWSPSGSLINQLTLNPVAHPLATTAYVLSGFKPGACPKPGKDTVIVTVRPKIHAFAGKDTSVVINQPLQLNATGGSSYQWSPGTSLSSTNIATPIALFNAESDGIRYKVLVFDDARCVDSAFLFVKIFRTLPTVFIPSAFTPNQDGRNDLVRPLSAGIREIIYFNIYNRWGKLVFSTTVNGKGWDGRLNGKEQAADTYVWVVKAIDYKGNPLLQKGTVTLIR
jgi:gliding motility-associated-like protein